MYQAVVERSIWIKAQRHSLVLEVPLVHQAIRCPTWSANWIFSDSYSSIQHPLRALRTCTDSNGEYSMDDRAPELMPRVVFIIPLDSDPGSDCKVKLKGLRLCVI